MKVPRITVLLPVFNGQAYLAEAVDSILAQTFRDLELLVLDDGSTDESPAILKSYRDPRVKVARNRRNLGLIKTLNLGFRQCRSPFIARMDSDDVSLPYRLERQMAFLERHPEVQVLGTSMAVLHGRHLKPRLYPATHGQIMARGLFESPMAHPTVVVRRTLAAGRGGLFREGYEAAEDYDLWSRLLRRGVRMHNLPEILLKYRVHDRARPRFEKNQAASTEKIREEWLRWFGLKASPREAALHHAAGQCRWPAGDLFLPALREWFMKLVVQNSRNRRFDPVELETEIGGRWLAALRHQGRPAWSNWKLYAGTPLKTPGYWASPRVMHLLFRSFFSSFAGGKP